YSSVSSQDLHSFPTRRSSDLHHWDSTYSGDYLSVSSSNMFITYNDTTSIQAIVNWQKAQGFGGFMTFTVDYEYLSGQTGNAGFPLSTALCQQTFGTCP